MNDQPEHAGQQDAAQSAEYRCFVGPVVSGVLVKARQGGEFDAPDASGERDINRFLPGVGVGACVIG